MYHCVLYLWNANCTTCAGTLHHPPHDPTQCSNITQSNTCNSVYTEWGSSDSYIDCIVVRASSCLQLVHPAHSISVHIIMCYHVQPMLPMWGAHNSLHNCSVFRTLQHGRMGSGISLKFFLALWEVEYGGPSLNLFLVQWKTFARGQLVLWLLCNFRVCIFVCLHLSRAQYLHHVHCCHVTLL